MEQQLIQIQSKICELRGQKVMFDFDLARLYGVETKQLKRAVRRNIERFEDNDFMFELSDDECSRCQIGTLNTGRGSNIKYTPFAFTDYNDINEDTRIQLELLNESLAELQVYKKIAAKPRNPLGYIAIHEARIKAEEEKTTKQKKIRNS